MSEQVDPERAKAELDRLPKADREWVLSLPAREAMVAIRLLIAFPGTVFTAE